MPKTLVMIPTYNESQNVNIMYERVRAALPNTEILFVDDNSPDGTGDILNQLASSDNQPVTNITTPNVVVRNAIQLTFLM